MRDVLYAGQVVDVTSTLMVRASGHIERRDCVVFGMRGAVAPPRRVLPWPSTTLLIPVVSAMMRAPGYLGYGTNMLVRAQVEGVWLLTPMNHHAVQQLQARVRRQILARVARWPGASQSAIGEMVAAYRAGERSYAQFRQYLSRHAAPGAGAMKQLDALAASGERALDRVAQRAYLLVKPRIRRLTPQVNLPAIRLYHPTINDPLQARSESFTRQQLRQFHDHEHFYHVHGWPLATIGWQESQRDEYESFGLTTSRFSPHRA